MTRTRALLRLADQATLRCDFDHAARLRGKAERAEMLFGKPLPSWCDNLEGQLLVSAIMDERPGIRVGDAMGFRVEEYRGPNAVKLRRLFDRTLAATECGSDAEWTLLNSERPDELIKRILGHE